jgi:hypothetical protein
MQLLMAALLATTAFSEINLVEPNEDAMRGAFASELSQGVRSALAYVVQTGGAEALARIRAARTDEFEIRAFRKIACRQSDRRPGHTCAFAVEVDTVAGPIVATIAGRFFLGPCGLAYEEDA